MIRWPRLQAQSICVWVEQTRGLKTQAVREYKPLFVPPEFRFYQRLTNNPRHLSGVIFNNHHSSHRRWEVRGHLIDYMRWGRETGQAQLPHRHQRTAFDFNDSLHPTNIPEYAKASGWSKGQDPTGNLPSLSSSYDPNFSPFTEPKHMNNWMDKRGPADYHIDLKGVDTSNLLWGLSRESDVGDQYTFGNGSMSALPDPAPYYLRPPSTETAAPAGRIPGIHTPFLGEPDTKMMQAMAMPSGGDPSKSLVMNNGRFNKTMYLNRPDHNNTFNASLLREVEKRVDQVTNGVTIKLGMLTAAQSGVTDFFCGGLDYESMAFHLAMRNRHEAKAAQLEADMATKKTDGVSSSTRSRGQSALVQMEKEKGVTHWRSVLQHLQGTMRILWRVYSSPKPFMTLVNGKARNAGCGLALLSKYAAVKDSTELLVDGPNVGVTPFGGMSQLLARHETQAKFPGLAEFVALTGAPLYAGDILKLGWTDLYTNLSNIDYHAKEWFNSTEHLATDAVAWQLGQFLETCFKMKGAHSTILERSAVTPQRALWIEDIFADQPNVSGIMESLSAVEKLPLDDKHNTQDANFTDPYTLSVEDGINKLKQHKMQFALKPWDGTDLPEGGEVEPKLIGELFLQYLFEKYGNVNFASKPDVNKLQEWQQFRYQEYLDYKSMINTPHTRHVFIKLDGCESLMTEFDFDFGPFEEDSSSDTNRLALEKFRKEVCGKFGMPAGREVEIGWCMPTFDVCHVRTDEELFDLLHHDPGVEDPSNPHRYPPIYFVLKRQQLHFSEWAYAVKHQLLLQSPFALCATFQLLQDVKGSGGEMGGQSTAESLATEYRYAARLVKRQDFYEVGVNSNKTHEDWEEIVKKQEDNVHFADEPDRVLPSFEKTFEKNVSIDGHSFSMRPAWSPRTIKEVEEVHIAELRKPLSFEKDGVCEIHPPTYTAKITRIFEDTHDCGIETVAKLGETEPNGKALVQPLKSEAEVPENVNFYRQARHPWLDVETSWRINGFTENSKEYFEKQYHKAEQAVYDSKKEGAHNYWPSSKEPNEWAEKNSLRTQ